MFEGVEKRAIPERCSIHAKQLEELWVSVRGNGHPENGLVYKVQLIQDRQISIKNFIDRVDRVFWWVIGSSLIGIVSAIGAFSILIMKLLFKNGQL